MKTRVFKNSESYILMYPILVVTALFLAGILLSVCIPKTPDIKVPGNEVTDVNFSYVNSQNFDFDVPEQPDLFENNSGKPVIITLIAVNEVVLGSFPEMEIEVEKLHARNNRISEKIELEMLTAKIQDYIEPEKEPELDLSVSAVIDISDREMAVEMWSENPAQKSEYIKFEYLENMAKQRYNEILEFYTLEKRIREYLVIEQEPTLELEDWMTSEKCWCHQLNEPVATNDINNYKPQ